MVSTKTPTLAKIKTEASETDLRALLSSALCEVCDFFNVGKNMNDRQIALTVDLIIDRFWDFKLEEIKFCFRRAMMSEKVYDRIDGNVIISWLIDYDIERSVVVAQLAEEAEKQKYDSPEQDPDAVSFDDFVAGLRKRSETDPTALGLLKEMENSRFLRLKNNETKKTDN